MGPFSLDPGRSLNVFSAPISLNCSRGMRAPTKMADTNDYTRPLGGRRSDRLLWPVPIRVTGTDFQSVPFVEDAVTVSINHHGACISLTRTLLPDGLIL